MAGKNKSQAGKSQFVEIFQTDATEVIKLITAKSEAAVENNLTYTTEEYAEKLIKSAQIAILK
jgi:hypothetical protein